MKKYILGLILLLGMSLPHHLQAQVAGRTADQFRVNESGAASYQIPIMPLVPGEVIIGIW
ncbi:MAG: hypothetical protein AAFP02_26505 [Bacteroidota bacterium]